MILGGVAWASEKDKYLTEKVQIKKHKSSIVKEQGKILQALGRRKSFMLMGLTMENWML